SSDFSRSRPYNPSRKPYDYIQVAREEGPSIVQAFHESMEHRGGRLYAVIADVCAFANTNGGTIYIGLSADKHKKPKGIANPQQAIEELSEAINTMISPPLDVTIDTLETQGKTIIRIQVPYGEDRPYAIDNSKIYVRDEADTSIALRDEIVNLVKQGLIFQEATTNISSSEINHTDTQTLDKITQEMEAVQELRDDAPNTGVEIVGTEQRNNTRYYIMRDLRNGNIVKNVTRSSARRLWHYAIKQWESNPVKPEQVQWHGSIGLWRRYKRGGETRYDLVQRHDDGHIRIYYGVTEGGMSGPWSIFLEAEEE
ncbi:MAG: ATP-binding protein, partial [Chloroflexi bacterium]